MSLDFALETLDFLPMRLGDTDDVPLVRDLDDDEESPFLRRQRAVGVRGRRVSRRLRWLLRWVLFGVTVLLPVGYVGYSFAVFAFTSPRFLLASPEDIVLRGNEHASREEILSALGIMTSGPRWSGMNIFRLSLEDKRKQVEAIPWVRSATLTRAYPHRLGVDVVERVPVAFVNVGGRVLLVDQEGVLLEKPEGAFFDFPVLKGLVARGGVTKPKSRLHLYLEFNRQLTEVPRSGWLVSEIDLADPDDLKALLVQGQDTIQVHFGRKDFLERFHNFLALLPELRKMGSKIDSVDLRFRNQLVVSPREQ